MSLMIMRFILVAFLGLCIYRETETVQERICRSVDVRKKSHLKHLRNCTVIEGDLYMVMVTLTDNETFPMLREITGSLIMYYVKGLKTLETYFPSLAVIRGQTLAYNYALVIKDTTLQYIGLVGLRLVLSGGIRIDSNPSLCYTSSVRWESIVKQEGVSIKIVNNRQICPEICASSCQQESQSSATHKFGYCWSRRNCQHVCSSTCELVGRACFINDTSQCCHSECLGGCYGKSDDMCVSCKNVLFKGRCVKNCGVGFYKFKSRRCVSFDDCMHMVTNKSHDSIPYAIEGDSCVSTCSPGKQRNKTSGHCFACGDSCPKKNCGEILIHSLNDLDAISGCYSVKELYISIREGGSSFLERIQKAFSKLEVIENSLKIIRSSSVTSLDFLKSLRLIKGESYKNRTLKSNVKSIVFEVYDNENLVEIWANKSFESDSNITIRYGSVSFSLNRKLCPEKITKFIEKNVHTGMKVSASDMKIMEISNGDTTFCQREKLLIEVTAVTDSSVSVLCKSNVAQVLAHDSSFAALFMLKESSKNVSQYELYTSCSDQNWRIVEGSLNQDMEIKTLKPAVRYALYAEAIRSRVENWLEISEIIYFTTKTKHPSPPVNLRAEALSSSEIKLIWNPPIHPNGLITKYFIWYREIKINPEEFQNTDICSRKFYFLKKRVIHSTKQTKDEEKLMHFNHTTCDCRTCNSICNGKAPQRQKETSNSFDFNLQDYYISQHFTKHRDFDDVAVNKSNSKNPCEWTSMNLTQYLSKCHKAKLPESNWTLNDTLAKSGQELYFINNTSLHEKINESNDKHSLVPSQNVTVVFDGSLYRQLRMVEVPASINSFVFSNLRHYTEYHFEIQACQDTQPDDQVHLTNVEQSYHYLVPIIKDRCSIRSSISAHTRTKENMDDVDLAFVRVNRTSNTIRIFWKEPEHPNGLIIFFLLRYREINSNNNPWFEQCISRTEWFEEKGVKSNNTDYWKTSYSANAHLHISHYGGIILPNLRSGRYEFQLKSFSLATNGSWTNSSFFDVPSDIGDQQSVLISLGILLPIVIVIVAFIFYRVYKQRHLKNTKMVSSNPDYWIIYEIDEWEIERKDVDMIDWNFSLGRGSFGMVYKGILKKLTTPAKDVTFDRSRLVNIPVAVKTLNPNSTVLERREFINEACYMKQFQSSHLVQLYGVVSKIDYSRINKHTYQRKKILDKLAFFNRLRRQLWFYCWDIKSRLMKSKTETNVFDNTSLDGFSSSQHNVYKLSMAQYFHKMPLVIMELMEFGDLTSYLRKQGEDGEGFVSDRQCFLWALQIADGMLYLSDMKFVHRDLAARNCMVNEKLVVKIGDFGMARDVYYDCYYRKKGQGRLPIRWMAPESLLTAYFTLASDVWSYGVVLWEICTLASLPFRGMSHFDVIQYVSNGGTLLCNSCPSNCSKIILNIMQNCWNFEPEHRPTFVEILLILEPHTDDNFRSNSFYFQRKQSVIKKPRVLSHNFYKNNSVPT